MSKLKLSYVHEVFIKLEYGRTALQYEQHMTPSVLRSSLQIRKTQAEASDRATEEGFISQDGQTT